jgi:hypothetical protein
MYNLDSLHVMSGTVDSSIGTVHSPSQGIAGKSLEAGLGVAVGVAFVLASTLIDVVAGESAATDKSASLTVLGLMVLGLVAGIVVRYLASRPLVTVAACLTIWMVLATSPVYPFHLPDWARFSWELGDLGALTMLSGVLLGLAVRGLWVIKHAQPRDASH